MSLIQHTKNALSLAIDVCKPGTKFNLIGKTIQDYCDQHGYSTVQEFSGHGIGTTFHQSPLILHFKNDEPGTMQPGMVFTIEPMLNQGSKNISMYPDGWTTSTIDGGRSAQFEHTIIITNSGFEILTI
ncbi:Methionine aminopeptidase 1D, chloroplastic/mitochondrial [Smittium mucronatum]|uniref:Methionine aminopeptidase 1D, chloroplastic/mitochondrial n=1 Tax=Smittium mucronatum TaxID=133383 RepID=A0A1R0H0N3_9FUNG|nr:Methionine aminopeptidase 1D, chloroplastic/mitochondrial [Smittium mucronatum]